jgi:hypothetical protein
VKRVSSTSRSDESKTNWANRTWIPLGEVLQR